MYGILVDVFRAVTSITILVIVMTLVVYFAAWWGATVSIEQLKQPVTHITVWERGVRG